MLSFIEFVFIVMIYKKFQNNLFAIFLLFDDY